MLQRARKNNIKNYRGYPTKLRAQITLNKKKKGQRKSYTTCVQNIMRYFVIQKLFSFTRFHLLADVLSAYTTMLYCLKNLFLCQWIQDSTFSSITFRVSSLMSRVLIHLTLSFVQGYNCRSIWILLHVVTQFGQHSLLKMQYFFFWYKVFYSLSKIRCPQLCGFMCWSLIQFYWSTCVLWQYHTVFIMITLLYNLRLGMVSRIV